MIFSWRSDAFFHYVDSACCGCDVELIVKTYAVGSTYSKMKPLLVGESCRCSFEQAVVLLKTRTSGMNNGEIRCVW